MMHEVDGVNTGLLKTLHETVGRGLGVAYMLCDGEGHVLYQHKEASPLVIKGDQLHAGLLKTLLKALARGGPGAPRKVTLIPDLLWASAAAIEGASAAGAFVWSGPYLSRTPLESDLEATASKLDLPPRSVKAHLPKMRVSRSADAERIADFLGGVAAVVRHLFEDREARRREREALNVVLLNQAYLNSPLATDAVLKQVLDGAVRNLCAAHGALMLVEPHGELRVLMGDESAGLDGVATAVVQEGAPHLASGTICVPLIAKGQVIGTLNLTRPDGFVPDDLQVATALAAQAAMAIENSRLYDRLTRKLDEMRAIVQVANDINSVLDRKMVLQSVLDQSIKLLRARHGSLMLLDQDTEELYIEVAHGLSRDVVDSVRLKSGEGVAGKVLEEGRPRLMHKGVREAGSEGERREYSAAMSVPLSYKDKIIGVLNVSDKLSGENFKEEEMGLLMLFGNQAAVALENSRLHLELQDLFVSSITALANAIDARDPYTRGHSERVAKYAVRIGERLGLDGNDLDLLKYAALLHDVGKIHVRDEILHKPGKLTDEEFQKMKLHPVYGAEIIRPIKAFSKILPFIFYHHERYCALGGYPHGITGTQIPLEARVITVADSYDAMTSSRPYRKAMSVEQAVAELRRFSGTQFDPHVVDIFLQILEEDPELAHIGIRESESAETTGGWTPTWSPPPVSV
ncbi:MAG: HD domain-containing phosphohydrolase [Candidatus Xenobia bacterium]